ncbi:MAG: hypothetical protein HWE30_08110 [Methylocystaceae bacterium]|nr:hypothetical protein [Methylocystaceae bacterium]
MSAAQFKPEDWVYVPDTMGRIGLGYYKNRNNQNQTMTAKEFERRRAQPVAFSKAIEEQIVNKKVDQPAVSSAQGGQLATAGNQQVSLTPWDNPVVGEQTASPARSSLKKTQEEKESQTASGGAKEKKKQTNLPVSQSETGSKAQDAKSMEEDTNPNGGTGEGASKVVCTELRQRGLMSASDYLSCYVYAKKKLPAAFMAGYHFWAIPYVRLMRRNAGAVWLIQPFVKWRTNEVSFRLGRAKKGSVMGKIICALHDPLCTLLGYLVTPEDYQVLYEAKTVK